MIHRLIHRYLDASDRLGEILFGLIMALGFTGAVRLGREEADNLDLFIGIFGCNLAWAIVDGVMFVLGALFERGRQARAVRDILSASSDESAMKEVEKVLDQPFLTLMSAAERQQIQRWTLELVRRVTPQPPRVQIADLLGGVAVGLIIMLSTFPVVIPFLVLNDPNTAVRVSNALALTQLFLLGIQWGRIVGGRPFRIGAGLTLVGLLLVGVTIVLGG